MPSHPAHPLFKPLTIGPYTIENPVILAPMAGVTDRPFRQLCKSLGAGLAVSEMVGAISLLQGADKTLRRANHDGEVAPIAVQMVGACPEKMAQAAKVNQSLGAQIIDINMGCPAKKICKTLAGSSLLRDEKLVAQILQAVVSAVDVPVTLKIRTGWDEHHKNGLTIAKIAEEAGIQALSVHGRTRCDMFKGDAEYDTIAQIKANISIPVIANGDIDSPDKARQVLEHTQADGLMIGRAAQGRPWIFRDIVHHLKTGDYLQPPSKQDIYTWLSQHLETLYDFYGEHKGVLMARKHVSWYSKGQRDAAHFRIHFNTLTSSAAQRHAIAAFFLHQDDSFAA